MCRVCISHVGKHAVRICAIADWLVLQCSPRRGPQGYYRISHIPSKYF